MLIKMKDLNQMVPDIKGDNSNLYFLSESYLIKRFLRCYGPQQRYKLQRYEKSKGIGEIKGLVLPVDILETEKGFCGYVEPVIPGTHSDELVDYCDIVNANRYNITLEEISSYILKCLDIVERCHSKGIVNPDMATGGNVKFNKRTGDVSFTDYQDMQVGDIETSVISSFIAGDPILSKEKYYKDGVYSPNIDLYTLAIRFLYYASKINVPRAIVAYDIRELLDLAGISNTYFGECMRVLYDQNKDNLNIRDAVLELSKEYKLTPFRQGEIRRLVKK